MAGLAAQCFLLPICATGRAACHIRMTTNAVILYHLATGRSRLDVQRNILESKGVAVMKTIAGLGEPLANKVMRNVTVIAGRHMLMAALVPAFINGIHDMTVRAGRGIVAQIGGAFGILKGIDAKTGNPSCQKDKQQQRPKISAEKTAKVL